MGLDCYSAPSRLPKGTIYTRNRWGESPLDSFGDLRVPAAEKVFVDIAVNPEFDYLQGSEVYTICERAFRSYALSRPAMLRYARRRGCTDAIKKLFSNIDLLDHD